MPQLVERWKVFLYHASRSRGFLWKFAVITLLAGAATGWMLGRIEPSKSYLFGERVLARAGLTVLHDDEDVEPVAETDQRLLGAFNDELSDTSLRFVDVIWAIPDLAPFIAVTDHAAIGQALGERFDPVDAELTTDYLAACNRRDAAAFERLRSWAERPEPRRFARFAFGQVQMKRKNYSVAYEFFRAEGEREEAAESRYMGVRALAAAKDGAKLDALRKDPRYVRFFSPYTDLQIAIGARDWWGIVKSIPATQIYSYQHNVIFVTLIAGFAWSLFLAHLGEVRSALSGTAALCAAGFVAGVISTTPTVFLVVWQDDILNFSTGADIYRTFAYYIAGVGAREELCKLLLFAPLLPFLIKRNDELEAFIVAAFVGLGFAIEENGNYFMMSAAASAPGRFLTANFFHIALTGLNGLALFRACTRGVNGVNDLMLVLPMTILAHGAYDALLDLPGVEDGGFFAMIVYIGFAYYFFGRVQPLRSNARMTPSLTASFVVGLSVLGATVVAFQMATLGAAAGGSLIFSELLNSGILVVMFFREFDEPLTV